MSGRLTSNAATAYVFDIDGTLVNSRRAVYWAYSQAGIEMPEEAWGRPWHDWLIDCCGGDESRALDIHRLKNKHYLEGLDRFADPTPLAAMARQMVDSNYPVYVITGGSQEAASIVLKLLGIDLSVLYDTGLSYATKAQALEALWLNSFPRGVYFDDFEVKVPTGWTFVRVQ